MIRGLSRKLTKGRETSPMLLISHLSIKMNRKIAAELGGTVIIGIDEETRPKLAMATGHASDLVPKVRNSIKVLKRIV